MTPWVTNVIAAVARSRWLDPPAASCGVMAVVVTVYLIVHARAGFGLPVPWPDEFHFMLSARALVEHGSLVAREVHPARPLMWMPPGYAFALAPVFALTGFSLAAARWLSAIAAVGAAVCVWRYACRRVGVAIATLGSSLILLHPAWIVMGNVARMEAIVLLMVSGGFVLLAHERWYLGVALLAATPLVHPHGAPFLVSGLGIVAVQWRSARSPRRPNRGDAIAVAVVASAWVAYLGHVVWYFDAFVEDMSFQISRKASRAIIPSLLGRHSLVAVGLCIGVAASSRRRQLGWMLALALPAWLVQRLGHEMWYQAFDALFAGLVAMTGVAILVELHGRLRQKVRRYPSAVATAVVAAAAAGLLFVLRADRPRRPRDIRWHHMTIWNEPYFDDEGLADLRTRVAQLGSRSPITLEVLPRGDAIFLLDLPGVDIIDPVRVQRKPDVRLYHRSNQHPRHWRRQVEQAITQAQADQRAAIMTYEASANSMWIAF